MAAPWADRPAGLRDGQGSADIQQASGLDGAGRAPLTGQRGTDKAAQTDLWASGPAKRVGQQRVGGPTGPRDGQRSADRPACQRDGQCGSDGSTGQRGHGAGRAEEIKHVQHA